MENYLKQLKNVSGIVQIGANTAQEMHIFTRYTRNIILIEPIPELSAYLAHTYPEALVVPCALGSEDTEMDLNLASNNGESSSLLTPTKHKEFYPHIKFDFKIEVPVRKFSTIVDLYDLDMSKYNVLVSDTQGYDLECFKGFGDYINNFEMIISEYINTNQYENDSNLESLVSYLIQYGFSLDSVFDENIGCGNAVFFKQKK